MLAISRRHLFTLGVLAWIALSLIKWNGLRLSYIVD